MQRPRLFVFIAFLLFSFMALTACGSQASKGGSVTGTSESGAAAGGGKPESGAANEEGSNDTPTTAPEPQPEMKSMRVGLVVTSGTQAPMWVAAEGGYFEKYGLDVNVTVMGNNAKTVAGVLSGDIQIGTIGVNSVISSHVAGGDLVTISDMVSQSAFRLYGAPNINSVEELKGKRLGIPSLGSSADMEARFILDHFGMKAMKDVQIVGIGAQPEVYAAIASGNIQAGTVVAPFSFRAEEAGLKLLVQPSQAKEWGIPSAQAQVVTTRGFLEKNPITAELFMKAYLEAIHRTLNDREFTVKILEKYTEAERVIAEKTYDDLIDAYGPQKPYIADDRVQKIIDFLSDEDPRIAQVKPADVLDLSILKRLDESGFIDQIGK